MLIFKNESNVTFSFFFFSFFAIYLLGIVECFRKDDLFNNEPSLKFKGLKSSNTFKLF